MAGTPWYRTLELKVFLASSLLSALILGPVLALVRREGPDAVSLLSSLTSEHVLLWGALVSILSLALGYSFTWRLTRRLAAIQSVVERISQNELEVPMPPCGRDQVGDLSVSVKLMAVKLRQTIERLLAEARNASELTLSSEVGRRLLPPAARHRLGAMTFESDFRLSHQCSGDWWGLWSLPQGRALFVIVDVLDEGPAAALTVASIQSWFAIMCTGEPARLSFTFPAEILSDLNAYLWKAGHGRSVASVFMANCDVRTGEMVCANAGHAAPLLLRLENGTSPVVGALPIGGALVGLGQAAGFRNTSVSLEPGDRILFYTDGLVECRSAQQQRISRRALRQFLGRELAQESDHLAEKLSLALSSFFRNAPLDDDIGAVLLSFEPGSQEP